VSSPPLNTRVPNRDTTRTISSMHTHNVQWLHHLLRIYRVKSLTTCKQLHRILCTFPPNKPYK
jgi:hypothetical protein